MRILHPIHQEFHLQTVLVTFLLLGQNTVTETPYRRKRLFGLAAAEG